MDRDGAPKHIVLHVGSDDNSETLTLNTLQISEILTTENIYILNEGVRCSTTAPQEGELCTIGGLTQQHLLNPECLELDFEWHLKDKQFSIQFTTEQMRNWITEYTDTCKNLEITEQSNITIRVKQRMGKARITLPTYEDNDLKTITTCKKISDTRIKVDQGKGEWLSTSKVTLGGRVEEECTLIIDMSPCTIIGPNRKTVSGQFTLASEVAYGIRTPKVMKIIGGEQTLVEIKLPKLYTDVNYDITYGVQTLQVLASRVGDVFGDTGDYAFSYTCT